MIPKVHAKGSSFKGAAAYLLHDKDRAATSGRVAWTETVNLTTQNPQAAWRVMAATAMNANALKVQAGVKQSGRTSKDAVLHLSLSWSPGQQPSREEMSQLARRALIALKADDRQALVICHSDEKHPHVHILVNRISSQDGRMLSSSNEKLALSELALAYEKECGAVLVKQREVNSRKRKRGERVRATKELPRQEFEALREGMKEADKEIPASLKQKQPQVAAHLRARNRVDLMAQLAKLREKMRPQWQALYQRQRQATEKGRQQKAEVVQRLVSLFSRKGAVPSPAPSFTRQAFGGRGWDAQAQAHKQRIERAELAGKARFDLGAKFAEIRLNCKLAVQRWLSPQDKQGGIERDSGRPLPRPGVSRRRPSCTARSWSKNSSSRSRLNARSRQSRQLSGKIGIAIMTPNLQTYRSTNRPKYS